MSDVKQTLDWSFVIDFKYTSISTFNYKNYAFGSYHLNRNVNNDWGGLLMR